MKGLGSLGAYAKKPTAETTSSGATATTQTKKRDGIDGKKEVAEEAGTKRAAVGVGAVIAEEEQDNIVALPPVDSDDEFAPPTKSHKSCVCSIVLLLVCLFWSDTFPSIAGAPSSATKGKIPITTAVGNLRNVLCCCSLSHLFLAAFVPPQVRRGKPNQSTEDLSSMGFASRRNL